MQLRNIGKSRQCLSFDSAKLLCLSLVISKIDYCNSLLIGCPQYLLDKVQRIQNTAARIVTRCRRSTHISPFLKDLHWLPVRQRVQYKILCFAYKCKSGSAPEYLSEIVQDYQPRRSLRSENSALFVTPRVKLSSYGRDISPSPPPVSGINFPNHYAFLLPSLTLKVD